MIFVDNEATRNFVANMAGIYEDSEITVFNFDSFSEKVLDRYSKLSNRKYPYIVNIPKGINRLLRGDFEPAYSFEVKEPIKDSLGNEIWYGDSRKGLYLRAGYRDNDSTLICEQGYFTTQIHALLGGKTGMGKSNTVNTLLACLMQEYAPWELQIYLLDAKVVEFKPFADHLASPHIKVVAATEDADYMVSLLEYVRDEMNNMNSFYDKADASKNIEDFRNATGLNIPQTLIVFDEFQTAMKDANRAKKMLDIIERFARLGRNTGYHLLLCSQGLDSSINKDLLDQFKIRMALPVSSEMSEKLLGNDGAGKIFERGELLINTEPDDKLNGLKNNSYYRVPYIPSSSLARVTKDCRDLGNKFNIPINISSYNDKDRLSETEFEEVINSIPRRETDKFPLDIRFYLGAPCFVYRDEYKLLNIQFTDRDYESMLISAGPNTNLERHAKLIKYNISRLQKLYPDKVSSAIVYADYLFEEEVGFQELTIPQKFNKINSVKDAPYRNLINNVYVRLLALNADSHAFRVSRTDENSEAVFEEILKLGGIEDTKINRVRCYFIMGELKDQDKYKLLNMQVKKPGDTGFNSFVGFVRNMILFYKNNGCGDIQLTTQRLTIQFNIIAGLNNILGLGIDSKTSNITALKNALIASKDVRIKFILITKSMDEMKELTKIIGFTLVDQLDYNERTRAGLVDPPDELLPALCLFQTLADKKILKFKKLALNSELN